MPAAALAIGAAFVVARASSLDAEAKTAKAAARQDRLATTAKTAPADLKELSATLNDCMTYSNRVQLRLSRSEATPRSRRLHRATSCGCMLRISSLGPLRRWAYLHRADKARGPEPCGVRAS